MRKINEFSDQGGEVSYNHMNNVVAGDGFEKINSKWMATNKPKIKEKKSNADKVFGKKMKFSEFYENKKNNSEKVINIVKYGDKIDNKNFWDNFIDICANSSAMSELLEIPKEKIIKWAFKIKNIKNDINNDERFSKNNKII